MGTLPSNRPPLPSQPSQLPPSASRVGPQVHQSQTPSTRRILDMLGPTDMGKLSVVFRELVRMLKDLPPGGFEKAYSKTPTAKAVKPVRFMCDKQAFKEVVRLAEMGASLAVHAHKPRESLSDPLAETVLAGIKSLEAKVDQLAFDTAILATKQATAPKSYSEATAQPGPKTAPQPKLKPAAKGKKSPAALVQPKAPRLTLSQSSSVRDRYVELTTDASKLASRATAALSVQTTDSSTPPPSPYVRSPGITSLVICSLNSTARQALRLSFHFNMTTGCR